MVIDTLSSWHSIVSLRNISGLDSLISEDCVFHSPVVHAPQIGKELTIKYLSAAFKVFINGTFEYVREVSSDNQAVLEFKFYVNDIIINGVDIISWNEGGEIIDFKVMIRPLKAVKIIHEHMENILALGEGEGN
ncbi:MAG: nuclear transport factor 2 family protein [Hellea sp.]|nr:nuclear transport factor 2 family protein [Hellea sp.]